LCAGKILTIETVALKLSKKQWTGPEINPDQTCFHDEYMRHLLYITRIYFRYGLPEPELIGIHRFRLGVQEKGDYIPTEHVSGAGAGVT